MATLGRRTTLRSAISSLVRQTYRPHEIIVVLDDIPCDEVIDILTEYKSVLSVLSFPHQGLAGARNSGIRKASGDALVFLDDDDFLATDHLERLARLLSVSEAHVAYGDVAVVQGETIIESSARVAFDFELGDHHLLTANFLPIMAAAVRHSPSNPHFFDERLNMLEDWEYWLRRHTLGQRFVRCPGVSAYYRVSLDHKSMITDAGSDRTKGACLVASYDTIASLYPSASPVVRSGRQVARRFECHVASGLIRGQIIDPLLYVAMLQLLDDFFHRRITEYDLYQAASDWPNSIRLEDQS